MKPTVSSVQNRRETNRRFPVSDYNYQAISLREFKPSCAGSPRPTFDLISRDYFNVEARRSFVTETIVFGLIAVSTVPAVIDCARALHMFLRTIGAA